MNARERFRATMQYQPRDRCPIMDFGFWEETRPIWRDQGLPAGINPDRYFGMDPQWIVTAVNTSLEPGFEWTVLEDRGETEIIRDGDGAVKEQGKFLGTIPRFISHTLVDRASWCAEFAWRLDPAAPERYPANWSELAARYKDPARDYPLGINMGSLYGWIRDWMGVENLSLLVHDDRKLFEEMVETVTDCICETMRPALESGIQFDYALGWEDMCYRAGPLLSPKHFRQVLVPNYKRITALLAQYGVDTVITDCDGDIARLLPLWLEAGVNTMFPIEVGVWGQDPVKYRAEYGRDLKMIGGVGKLILAEGQAEITAEVERLAPLVEDGGYIPTPDHRVPPDVPLANYKHYLREARRVWGRCAPSLAPVEF